MLVTTTGNSAVGIDLGTIEPAVGDALAGSQPITTGTRWTGSLRVYTPIAVSEPGWVDLVAVRQWRQVDELDRGAGWESGF